MTLRQFLMLRFMSGHTYTEDQAILFRQRTFGSLCKAGWVNYNAWKKRFYITKSGTLALKAEKEHRLHRQSAGDLQFSVYARWTHGVRSEKVPSIRKAS